MLMHEQATPFNLRMLFRHNEKIYWQGNHAALEQNRMIAHAGTVVLAHPPPLHLLTVSALPSSLVLLSDELSWFAQAVGGAALTVSRGFGTTANGGTGIDEEDGDEGRGARGCSA